MTPPPTTTTSLNAASSCLTCLCVCQICRFSCALRLEADSAPCQGRPHHPDVVRLARTLRQDEQDGRDGSSISDQSCSSCPNVLAPDPLSLSTLHSPRLPSPASVGRSIAMRLAALGLAHETNTFSGVPASYDKWEILRGDEIRQKHATATTSMAGVLAASERLGFEVVPLIFAVTGPIGTITKDAFDRIVGEMMALLQEHGPWDGVLMAQHGAAVSEEYPDADGEIVGRARALVGPNVPIGVTPDMHANLSQKLIDESTITVVYATNPHLDPKERAEQCSELIVRTIKGEIHPVQALEMPPLVVNIVKQYTGEEPMKSIVAGIPEVMARPGMLSASVAEGYPYADVAEMGMAFLAIHDGDAAAAREAARYLADLAWKRRVALQGDVPSPTEALEYAVAAPEGPIVLMDVGDNIGGGSSADSTYLLAEAKRLGVKRFLQTLYDPEAGTASVAAGPRGAGHPPGGGQNPDFDPAPRAGAG